MTNSNELNAKSHSAYLYIQYLGAKQLAICCEHTKSNKKKTIVKKCLLRQVIRETFFYALPYTIHTTTNWKYFPAT